MADFAQGQDYFKAPVIGPLHGNVKPGSSQRGFIFFDLPDNFFSDCLCMTDIGAHPGSAGLRLGQFKGECQCVSAKAEYPGTRGRVLNYFNVLGYHYQRIFFTFPNKILK
jgi:hypothetical protein